MAFCTNCGQSLAANMLFCPQCGAASGQAVSVPPQKHGVLQAAPLVFSEHDDEVSIMSKMNDAHRMMFSTEMAAERKSTTTGVVLCLFLGGVGGHQFYLGNTALGIVYALFFWTFIPAIIAFFELFTMSGRVREHNRRTALRIAQRIAVVTGATVAASAG